MSLEQQIGALVKASENLTGAVNGKIGEIDKEVEQAKKEFHSFQESADVRYKSLVSKSFKVGGQWGKYYPVRIDLLGGPVNKLNIYRPDTYQNMGHVDGLDPDVPPQIFTASIMGIADSWGHRVPFYVFDTYHHKGTTFIGKVVNNSRVGAIWVWLRGGGITYYITHDSKYISSIGTYNEQSDDLASYALGIYLGGYKSARTGLDFPPILVTDIDPSLPNSGYIRGIA